MNNLQYNPALKNEYLKLTKPILEHIEICGGYKVIDKLGSGTYGDIYKVKNDLGQEFALKKYKNLESHGFDSDSLTELDILSRINHPNVTQVKDLFIDKCNPCLIMEMASMDLFNYMKIYRPDKNFSFEELYIWMSQLACGVDYLNSNGIIHRDLKELNILVYNNNLLIADFGMAQFVPNRYSILPPLKSFLTSVDTRAPEIWMSKEYDSRIDVWALGILFLQLLTHHNLWKEEEYDYLDDNYKNKEIFDAQYDILFNQETIDTIVDSSITDSLLNDLIKKMLTVDREKRIYSDEILRHGFFNNKCPMGTIEIIPDIAPNRKYDKDRYKLWNRIYEYLISQNYDISIWFLGLNIYDRYMAVQPKFKFDITLGDITGTCFGIAIKLLSRDLKYDEFSHVIKGKIGIISNPKHMSMIECDILKQLDFKLFHVFKYNVTGISDGALNTLKDMMWNYENIFI